ncbi:MAG: hypothetical protein II369_03815 [Clostridia bacterium]|jgi:hypothetical protein|nr:hypothetical protein [Clostridia bacterium]MBQ1963226.1 hypothetical protein [Clostridia bacterium]MBQ5833786.1 hypothetical protein [Clostridia bacterium]
MNQKMLMLAITGLGGAAALGLLAAAVWNSKQMRFARAMKRTECVLYKLGSVLQGASGKKETE